MTYVSLLLNIVILIPVVWAMFSGSNGALLAVGPDSPARQILACVYLAILLASLVLIYALVAGIQGLMPALITLFGPQIGYKLVTVAAVGLASPVVQVNLLVVVVHSITLASYVLRPSLE